jgi:serine/threonine protein kinase
MVKATPRLIPESLTPQRLLGEGAFGQVYTGKMLHDATKSGSNKRVDETIVMKRVKKKVEGGEEMHEMELKLNLYASSKCKGHIAEFIGWKNVEKEASRGGLITPGYYLRRRDCIEALSEDLMVPEEAVAATVMKHLLEALASFHSAGLVHRDVKP